MDLWELQEGIFLLLGRKPERAIFLNMQQAQYSDGSFWILFNAIKDVAERSIISKSLKVFEDYRNKLFCKLKPAVFLNWAQSKGYEIPEPFIGLCVVGEEENHNFTKINPSIQENSVSESTLNEKDVREKNSSLDHPELYNFIKTIKKQGYTAFIRNLEDCRCQFEKEGEYIQYVNCGEIVKENSKFNTDNSYNDVKDIAIIRKATHKKEVEKEVVVYRLEKEISNIEQGKIKEHRKIPLRTVQHYFSLNKS